MEKPNSNSKSNSVSDQINKFINSLSNSLVGLPYRKINDVYLIHNIRKAGVRGKVLILGVLMILFLIPGSITPQTDYQSPEISQHWLKDIWEKNRKENTFEDEGDAFQTNVLLGESSNNFFGKSAASAGDVNNDGFEDVIVGAYGNSSFKGKAYIFLGGVSIDNAPDIIFTGENDSDRFGYCVSTAGDVNGDGFDDVIVGAIGNNSMTGKAYIFLGGSSMNNVVDVVMTGEAAGSQFGVSVSTGGDINNDGFSDVIVGAEGYNSNTGRSYVFFGSALMNNSVDLTLNGIAAENFFGTSVSSAGDVNNDSYDDILVGAKGFSSNSGQAYIFFGGASPNNINDVVMTGDITSNLGNSVSFAGDVNGDGYDDVVIGAYTNSTIEYNGGKVCVYFGGALMDSSADVTFNTPGYNWQFGTTVASAKDMNGDGFSDILIGAFNGNNTLVFFGGASMNTVHDAVLQNGYLVSSAGDINGDGYTEVLIGNPSSTSSTGRVFVYNYAFENQVSNDLVLVGTPAANFTSGIHIGGDYNNDGITDLTIGASGVFNATGRAFIYRGGYPFDGGADAEITAFSSYSFFGNDVSSAGDVNGDGKDDLLVGAYRYSEPTGRAFLYYGEPSNFASANLTFTPQTPGLFGYSVSTAGDMNNDGYSDIVIGAIDENSFAGKVYVYFGGASMDNVADLIMNGPAAPDNLGFSVSSANVNNDSYSDLIIGAPRTNSETGKVYIFLGSAAPDTVADITLNGSASGDKFGYAVSSAGDVNNDNFEDVIVTSQGIETSYIFYGGAAMDNTPDITLTTPVVGDNFGASVSSAGDVNGDGFDEVVVGATSDNTFTGKAYVFLGGTSMDNTPDIHMTGEGNYHYFGWSVAGGDINNDGYSDIVVGAVMAESRGKAYIFLGSAMSSGSVLVTGASRGNGTYNTLSQAFSELNSFDQAGTDIVLRLRNNTTEPSGGAILNAGTWSTLSVIPEGAITVSCNCTPGVPLINLNGADNVRIDGLNTGGNSLIFSNTTVSATTGTSTIRFGNDACNNVITNCMIEGSSTTPPGQFGGTIHFGGDAVTTGSDNNVVSFCNIGPAGSNLPTQAVNCIGTNTSTALNNSHDTIRNCNIYDYFNATSSSAGVYVGSGNTDIAIANNKFYQTSLQTQTTGAQHSPVWINNASGNKFFISENIIGFASSSGTGKYSIAGNSGTRFFPVHANCGTLAITRILSNTITEINLTGNLSGTLGGSMFLGIYVVGGLADASGNTIGSMSSTGSINIASTSASAGDIMAIYKNGSGNFVMNNNNVGGLTLSNSGAGKLRAFLLFPLFGDALTCIGNIIGGNISGSNSLTAVTASEFVPLRVEGVTSSTVSSNTIRNCSVVNSSNQGMLFLLNSGGTHAVSQNIIYNLSSTNLSVAGMFVGGSGGTTVFERNLIYGLSTSANTANIRGITIAGLNAIYKNNMISLGNDSAGNGINTGCQILGINVEGGANNFYFNSVYVGGNPTSGSAGTIAFRSSVTNVARNYMNNAFFNARSNNGSTGKHYAISIAGGNPDTTGLALNYNDLFVNGNGGVLGVFNGVDQTTFASWKTATGQDNNSISADPKFISSSNLHVDTTVSSPLNNTGTVIAGITNDFDGQTRNVATPDIGADEFTGISGLISLNLTMLIEGFYNSSSNLQVNDTIRVYLRNSASPYAIVDSAKAIVSDSGKVSLTFSNAVSGSYYIQLKHRNSIETWSANSVALTQGNTSNYNFTNASSQAYGNNMQQVDPSPVRFAIFSGDVNQDGVVDGTDAGLCDNDVTNFASGYLQTDVNGDEIIDGSDASIVDNNAFNFVGKSTP